MGTLSEVVSKAHCFTSIVLDEGVWTDSSKCVGCGKMIARSTINLFETFQGRLKAVFGFTFKNLKKTERKKAGLDWTLCELCQKQLEVAELLFWKVFRTNSVEAVVSQDGERESVSFRQLAFTEEDIADGESESQATSEDEPGTAGSPSKKRKQNDGGVRIIRTDEMLPPCEPREDHIYLVLDRENEGEAGRGSGEEVERLTLPCDGDTSEFTSLVQCRYCQSFILESETATLVEHEKICASRRAGGREDVTPQVDPEALRCKFCPMMAHNRDELSKHYVTEHGRKDSDGNATTGIFLCDWCYAPFQTKKARKRHMTSQCVKRKGHVEHTSRITQAKCKYCDLYFPTGRSLFNHTYRAHNRYE